MFEYRQVLVRLRQGDTDRQIARSGLMGRRKAGEVREGLFCILILAPPPDPARIGNSSPAGIP